MVSYCRSALWALMLAAGAGFVSANAASAQFSSQNWAYARYENILPDGSVLTEYAGGTQDALNSDVRFRIGFIPRFGCVPLISLFSDVIIPTDGSAELLLATFSVPGFSIDRTPMSFPALIEGVDRRVVAYYNGDASRRIKLRLQVDEGGNAAFRFSNGHKVSFSLSGSRAVLDFADVQCRQHAP